jgi:hypothetical protein
MMTRRRWFQFVLSVSLSLAAMLIVVAVLPARSAVPHLGYGFNVGVVGTDAMKLQQMQFNWIKIFDVPGTTLPQSILLRVDVTHTTTIPQLLSDLDKKLNYLSINHLAVQAWEIGNEPNIDASYGWGAAPDPVTYKNLLCAAYTHLKAAVPDAIVVSAGLAPTGRVSTVPPHPDGNDGQAQDERKYLQQMLAAPGGVCLDAVGYHPYGYSANYDTPPDTGSIADPPTDCENGFCFRGAEKMYEVMQANGVGDRKMWATEFGWLTQPADPNCLKDPSWKDRQWQIVSDSVQAANLVGAFQYADANWPWMGALFVFNLDFNQIGDLGACDQMRSYDVEGKPAQSALTDMPKNAASIQGKLKTDVAQVTLLIGVSEQPITLPASISLSNWGWNPAYYTATASTGADVVPSLLNPTGMLSATAQQPLNLTITSTARTSGIYTGLVTVDWSATGVSNPTARKVNVELRVVEQVYRTYLPATMR